MDDDDATRNMSNGNEAPKAICEWEELSHGPEEFADIKNAM